MKITQAYLKQRLHYNPETGVFTWLPRSIKHYRDKIWNARYAGKLAGCTAINVHPPYHHIGIDYKNYNAHRLAFLYMTGILPLNDIDHINGNTLDNRWNNLHEASRSENCANGGPPKNNTSGYRGVSFNRDIGKYHAYITLQYKRRHFGFFDSLQEAALAYKKAARKYFGEFARL